MKVKQLSIALASLIFCAHTGFAVEQVESWSARSSGLGGASLGFVNSPDSPFYNPAGLKTMNQRGFSLTHGNPDERSGEEAQSEWSFSFIEAAPDTKRPFGLFINHNSTSSVATDQVLGLDMAGTLIETEAGFRLHSGLNLKYISRSVKQGQSHDKSSFGLDLGLLAVMNPRFSVGAAVRDVNRPKDTPGSDRKREPTMGVGTRLNLLPQTDIFFDIIHVRKNDFTDYRVGLEQWIIPNWLALRGGSKHEGLSVGLGFQTGKMTNFSFDYAYTDPYSLSSSHRRHTLSMNVRWGGPRPDVVDAPISAESSEGTDGVQEGSDRGGDRFTRKVRDMKRRREFSIGAEDTLQVEVKDHPELETIAKVDSWGFAKFPYIGDLRVEGNTPSQLSRRLEDLYQGFVEEPRVEVTISDYASRTVYVLGQVLKPGRYPIGGRQMTVRDVVVLAGLPTERAALWRVFVIRQTSKGPTYRPVNLSKILYRGRLENNIVLEADDIVYVPMGVLDTIVTTIGRLVSPLFGVAATAVTGDAASNNN